MPQYFFCHFNVWSGAAARRCQVLLDTHIFIKSFNRLVRYCLTRVLLLQRFNNLVRYYLTRYFLLKVLTGLSGTAWQKKIGCFFGNQINKHCGEVCRNTFSATSMYGRERRLAAVRYYLTRIFLLKVSTGLSGTAWQECFCYKDSTILSGTTWHATFC